MGRHNREQKPSVLSVGDFYVARELEVDVVVLPLEDIFLDIFERKCRRDEGACDIAPVFFDDFARACLNREKLLQVFVLVVRHPSFPCVCTSAC